MSERPTVEPHAGAEGRDPAELHALADRLEIAIWTPGEEEGSRWRTAFRAARESVAGRLPPRYATDTWHIPFEGRLAEALQPGVRILDVGAGARPMVRPEDRPEGCVYVGLDVDGEELRKAPPGSYDRGVVGDVCTLHEELVDEFDLVLTWLTMEHVRPVPAALHNLSRYQRPGGRILAYLAGGRAVHAVANRLLPAQAAKAAMQRLLGREPETVFPAHYDHCTYDELREIADREWSQAEIAPLFTGGWYFRFSGAVRAPYLLYEEWAYRGGHRNLASYYMIDAVR